MTDTDPPITPGYAEPDPLNFGHGVTGRFTSWDPDVELNPQYEGLGPVEHWGMILNHRNPGTGEPCQSHVTFDGPVQRRLEPNAPVWRIEAGWDSLTLHPSILCNPARGGCGLHGYIRNGRWEPA